MLRLMIFVSILSLVYGFINITSQPAKVTYGEFLKLKCDVGPMKDTIKWFYNGVTYFSCDPPYTNCYTYTKIPKDDYYDFTINDDSLIAIFHVKENHTGSTWSCYHGNEKADLEIDIGDAPRISRFSVPRTDKTTIQCDVESELPVDVVISAESYKEKKIIYDVKKSNLSVHSVETSILCSYNNIFCNITNGYGPIVSGYSNLYNYPDCPLKILYDFPINTNLVLNVTTIYTEYKIVYYVGYPIPSRSLYIIGADGTPIVIESFDISSSYHTSTAKEPGYINIITRNLDNIKTGKYILTVTQGNIAEDVILNIEKLNHSRTTNTTPEDDMDDKTIDIDKTTDMETNIMVYMVYLGVAAIVMTLVLVIILVIVGVLRFIRIKRKPTGPVDKNQDYSNAVQTPNNESDQTYEELDKL